MAYQEHYTQQLLDNLRAKLLIMGSKTQQALDDAAIAVLNHDLPRAAAVLDGDTDIDDLENQIDEATLNILARTQPVARDLRFLMSVVRMVLDLERIGDESVVVAEQVTLSDKPIPSIVEKDLRALCTARAHAPQFPARLPERRRPQRPCRQPLRRRNRADDGEHFPKAHAGRRRPHA